MRASCFLTLALILLASEFARGQAQLVKEEYDPAGKNKTELTVHALVSALPPSGYCPIRIFVRNDSKLERTWSFDFQSIDSNLESRNEMRSEFAVSCKPNSETEVDFLVPLISAFHDDHALSLELRIEIDAPAPLRSTIKDLSSVFLPGLPSIMMSENLHTLHAHSLSSALSSSSSSHHGYGMDFGSFHPKQMPRDWKAFAGFDVCLLTEDDWTKMNTGARLPLLHWVRLGGHLMIYSENSSTTIASLGIDKTAKGHQADLSWGSVRVETSSRLFDASAVASHLTTMGSTTGAQRSRYLRNEFAGIWPLQESFGTKPARMAFFILILIAFGILVGPVNLFIFAKAGQRHRLFITTPIISLGASALLIGLILFQDGFGGRGHRVVLMEIGPDNTAYLTQEQIARTGVLLRTGFETSESGFLSPVALTSSRFARVTDSNQGGKMRYTIEQTEDGLDVTGDWFQSRSEHGHVFETVRPTRGGISRVGKSSPPTISSTFEFPLETLYYLDEQGGYWTATDIQQGRNTTLNSTTESEFVNWFRGQQARLIPRNKKRLAHTMNRAGQFIGVSSEAPGVETIKAVNWEKTHTIITGLVP